MVGTADVQRYNLAVEFDQRCHCSLVCLPLVSFPLYLIGLLLEFLLHMQVVPLEELMIGDQLISDLVVLKCPLIEQIVDPGNVVGEDLLELLDARSPDALHFADAGHAINLNGLW